MSSISVAGDTSGSCTLQAPAVSGTSVLTLPVATDTLVGKATTDTLTNKTLTSPTISSLSSASATALTLQSAGTTAITVDTSQNVGIGTSSPGARLEIAKASGAADIRLSVAGTLYGLVYASASDFTINSITAIPLTFGTNNTEQMRIDSAGLLKFNSGYGSVATAYGCRAWVNFNGTGTVAITGSGNVSSITDNGTGDYTVNFTTAMVDANYCLTTAGAPVNNNDLCALGLNYSTSTKTTTALRLAVKTVGIVITDSKDCNVAIFR